MLYRVTCIIYVCDYAYYTSLRELRMSEEARLYSVPGASFAQIILMTPITLYIKEREPYTKPLHSNVIRELSRALIFTENQKNILLYEDRLSVKLSFNLPCYFSHFPPRLYEISVEFYWKRVSRRYPFIFDEANLISRHRVSNSSRASVH